MQKCRILIVEDELISRQAFRYILNMDPDNFEIVGEAHNGKEGLELLDSLQPHVVISDVVMPVMNGIDFTKAAKLRMPALYTIMLSGHSDFEYVKSAFQSGATDYILKSQIEPNILLDKLYGIMRKIGLEPCNSTIKKQNWLLSAIQGSLFTPPANLPSQHILLLCNTQAITNTQPNHLTHVSTILQQEAKKTLHSYALDFCITNDNFLLFLISGHLNEKSEMIDISRTFAQEASKLVSSLFWVMGHIFESVTELQRCYKNLVHLSGLEFYFPYENLVWERKIIKNKARPIFDMQSYNEKLQMRLFDSAYQSLIDFLNTLGSDHYLREGELKKMLDSAVYNAVDILMEECREPDALFTKRMHFFTAIDTAKNLDTLKTVVQDITQQLLPFSQQPSDPTDGLRQEMVLYIQNNYTQPITLRSLASNLHVSYSHLSSCWGRFFGCNFNEYLNNIRIKAAKHLLATTQRSVAEISEAVGYSEQGYFGKVFKKKTGLKPMEYRKRKSGGRINEKITL